MKNNRTKYFIAFTAVALFLLPQLSMAQYSVSSDKGDVNSRADSMSISLPKFLKLDIKNKAYYSYQKKKRRLERNFFETDHKLQFSQFAYSNWAGGGDNSFNGIFSTKTQYVYHYEKLAFDTYLNASFGLGTSNKKLKKQDDNFQLNSDISFRFYRKWNYTFGFNLASQFAPTNTYDGEGVKSGYSSAFFAPATLKPYLGITFKVSDLQKITISPLSGNIIMVFDKLLASKGVGGVEKGKNTKLSVGAFLNGIWTQNITKNGMLKYKAILQSFWDYKSNPNMSLDNWVDVKLFQYFTVGLNVKFIYDDKIKTPEEGKFFQIKQSLQFGISYNFKNKSKPTYQIIK